jgi:hypothetical protein
MVGQEMNVCVTAAGEKAVKSYQVLLPLFTLYVLAYCMC